ncbi:MAG: porin [Bordetella sp.]|nr:MAG: porin [Bordetella sp.]UOF93982.1 MAG: porin [Bordetella sp.]
MKKTLLAAALSASFSGFVQAETSVTLYGIVDTGIGYNDAMVGYNQIEGKNVSESTNTRIGFVNGIQSGSHWGLRGSEDLCDGLSASFILEGGFTMRSGKIGQEGRLFAHRATVGLSSDSLGSFSLGRQSNIASRYFRNIDPFKLSFDQASLGLGIGSTNSVVYDNMAVYQTPSINGFQLGIGYSFDVSDKDAWSSTGNDQTFTAGLLYEDGPLTIAASYDSATTSKNISGDSKDKDINPHTYALGASYDFEIVKLSMAYGRTNDGWLGSMKAAGMHLKDKPTYPIAVKDDFSANSYMVGLTAPLGTSGNVFTSWQHIASSNEKHFYASNPIESKQPMNVYSVGYTYELSKNTNLYAFGSHISDYYFIDNAKSSGLGVGIRHRF